MIKVNIFQPRIPSYREQVFERLASDLDLDLSVYFGYGQSPLAKNYKAILVPAIQWRGMHYQKSLSRVWRPADVNIIGFDLHWAQHIFLGLTSRRADRTVLWGHGIGRRSSAVLIRRMLANRVDAVLVYSKGGKARLCKIGVNEPRIMIAPNTVFVEREDELRFPKGDGPDSFLYFGRLQERKRLDLLIEAFAQYRRAGGSYRLRLVGDGEHIIGSLGKLVDEHGLTGFVDIFPGTFNEARIRQHMSVSVAYVSPGAVGLGIVHALAYGVPCITCRGLGHGPEFELVRDGENGIVTELSSGAIALALKRMEDPSLQDRLSRDALATYEVKASPAKMIDGFRQAIFGNSR